MAWLPATSTTVRDSCRAIDASRTIDAWRSSAASASISTRRWSADRLSVPVLDMPCDDLGGSEDVDTAAELDALRAGGPVTGAASAR